MSAISDALKRARRERPAGVAPAAGPALRPVDGAPQSGGVSFVYLLLLFLAILAVAGSLLWLWFNSGKTEIRARSNAAAGAPVQPAPVQPPATTIATPVESFTSVAAPATNTATPAPTPFIEAPKPDIQSFKLQGIFYRTQNPSAVVNRQTVFLGDKVDGARVTAIDRDSVTVVTATGQSKVLVLSQ